MIRAAIVAAALAVAACHAHASSPDGYTFDKAEFDCPTVAMSKKEYRTRQALRDAAPGSVRRRWKAEGMSEGAWGVLYGNCRCTVHIMDPTVAYEPHWVGHEAIHCFKGRFHK